MEKCSFFNIERYLEDRQLLQNMEMFYAYIYPHIRANVLTKHCTYVKL